MRDILDIWPPLPLIVNGFKEGRASVNNTIAALEHNDRVCQIDLDGLTSSQMRYVTDSAVMHKPFPELTDLRLGIPRDDGAGPVLPESFLGGTAPRLQSFDLLNISFLGLPKLLSSATHLVKLDLYTNPRYGYIPPEAMATSLESLCLYFRYPRPPPALQSRHPPPPPLTRSILPSLTEIRFKGASEY